MSENVQRIQLALDLIAAEATQELYKSAALMGAAMALCRHFGSAEGVEKAGLAKQLEYLLDEGSTSASVRNKLAFEWMCAMLPKSEPTAELAEVVFRIDHFAEYPAASS